jgi:Asp-tRNA(Asn)/Glu-tRNA(Gln) amidotransferase A subunit family amidase
MASGRFVPENRERTEPCCSPYNLCMDATQFTVRGLRRQLAKGEASPTALAAQALTRADGNANRNTYLWQDREWTTREAERDEAMPRGAGGPFGDGRSALWGLPISVKDCFDLAGAPTSCGVRFYRDLNGIAEHDSWLVERLRAAGAVITGKTHLHPLAYGITGENPEFGDCVQPNDSDALTGGSSSGAAASVQEGSAVAAIGTDTGGSIRAPAAFCGLAGYRATLGRGDWRGGAHLAESFDTMGWLFHDLEDAPLLTSIFAIEEPESGAAPARVGVVHEDFLHDCEPEIVSAMRATVRELEALGLHATEIDAGWWDKAYETYAPIQAWEAARIHAGHFPEFPAPLPERLQWGAAIKVDEIAALRQRHDEFRARMDDLFAGCGLLLMPATPVARLAAGADHSRTRPKILRYTTPFSLAGVPVVTIPCRHGGMQLAAARDCDEALAAIAARLGAQRSRRG